MGLVDKLLLRPWFKKIHDDGNILELNKHYKTQREDLEVLVPDPSSFMNGTYQALPDCPTTKDKVFESLTTSSECSANSFNTRWFSRQMHWASIEKLFFSISIWHAGICFCSLHSCPTV